MRGPPTLSSSGNDEPPPFLRRLLPASYTSRLRGISVFVLAKRFPFSRRAPSETQKNSGRAACSDASSVAVSCCLSIAAIYYSSEPVSVDILVWNRGNARCNLPEFLEWGDCSIYYHTFLLFYYYYFMAVKKNKITCILREEYFYKNIRDNKRSKNRFDKDEEQSC